MMEKLEELKEDYRIFKYATEEEFNTIHAKFKATLEYVQSEKEKTIAMTETFRNLAEFMKEITIKIETKDIQIQTLNTEIKTLEILIKTQNLKLQILENKIDSL
jgi:hypothetical protein